MKVRVRIVDRFLDWGLGKDRGTDWLDAQRHIPDGSEHPQRWWEDSE